MKQEVNTSERLNAKYGNNDSLFDHPTADRHM